MPGRSSGYRVDAGELQTVGGQYRHAGGEIRALRNAVVTSVTEQQLGRKFGKDIAPTYQKAFEQFQNNLTEFGRQAQGIGDRLNDVAGDYTRAEDTNRHRMRTVKR
jgi:hypothetical protein